MKQNLNIFSLRIGVVGCGEMGFPMLEALLRNNISAVGHDIRKSSQFLKIGRSFIKNKKKFFSHCDVVLSVVRDEQETLELTEGDEGIFKQNCSKYFLICSTLSPRFIQELKSRAPKNITLIDCPMSGASNGAREASLTFMVGSTKNEFKFVASLLRVLGKNIIHIGEFGLGMTAKVLNNFVTSVNVAAVRQVMDQAEHLNLSKAQLLKIMDCSSGQNWFGSNFEKIEWAKLGYNQQNTIGILEKDVAAYMDALENLPKSKRTKQMLDFQNATIESLRKIRELI